MGWKPLTRDEIEARKKWVEDHATDGFARLRAQRGLTHWIDGDETADLAEALRSKGASFSEREVPQVTGMGGCASVIHYVSPTSGVTRWALVVPTRAGVDSFGMTIFYFAQPLPAGDPEAMIAIYDACWAAKRAFYAESRELFARYDRGER